MREHFHVPDRYFLSHSIGCQPRRTAEKLSSDFLAQWATCGSNAWPDWMDQLETFRAGLGRLLGSDAANICPQVNVSSALTKIIYAVEKPETRRTILCTEDDFPTIGFVLKQAERSGFQLRFVEGDVTDPSAWEDAIDDSVAFVHITHAFSNTSRPTPLAEICALARSAGAISIIDIAQSACIVPIDLSAWGADFAIGTGVKYLSFGQGACFLYASPDRIEQSAPIDVGWFSHENPFEMDIHHFQYAPDAMRFFGGTPSPAPLIAANAAIELWEEIGLDRVRSRAQSLLGRLVDAVPDDWLVSPREPTKRGGTLVLNPPNRPAFSALAANKGFRFDERKYGFRFSLHGYTSDEDVKALIDVINEAA